LIFGLIIQSCSTPKATKDHQTEQTETQKTNAEAIKPQDMGTEAENIAKAKEVLDKWYNARNNGDSDLAWSLGSEEFKKSITKEKLKEVIDNSKSKIAKQTHDLRYSDYDPASRNNAGFPMVAFGVFSVYDSRSVLEIVTLVKEHGKEWKIDFDQYFPSNKEQ
jgi:hypothetical protein